jgi:signal peptidase I
MTPPALPAVHARKRGGLFAILLSLGVALLFSIPITLFFLYYRAFSVPTRSMEDTVLLGDSLLVQVRGIGPVHIGEVVVFSYPPDPKQTLIKRVEGMPGDRLKIKNKQLYRNGVPVREPYIRFETNYVDSYRDNFPSERDPMNFAGGRDMLEHHVMNGGEYFVLGDNRDYSLDSRYWGFVEGRRIFGKPLLVYLSRHAGRTFQRIE